MLIFIQLNPPLGDSMGPNFAITANVGIVVPSTATIDELFAGIFVDVDDTATTLTITSEEPCSESIKFLIRDTTTTSTSTSSTSTSSTTTSSTSTSSTSTSTSTSTSSTSTSSTTTSTTTTQAPIITSTTTSTSTSTSSSTTSTTTTAGPAVPTGCDCEMLINTNPFPVTVTYWSCDYDLRTGTYYQATVVFPTYDIQNDTGVKRCVNVDPTAITPSTSLLTAYGGPQNECRCANNTFTCPGGCKLYNFGNMQNSGTPNNNVVRYTRCDGQIADATLNGNYCVCDNDGANPPFNVGVSTGVITPLGTSCL